MTRDHQGRYVPRPQSVEVDAPTNIQLPSTPEGNNVAPIQKQHLQSARAYIWTENSACWYGILDGSERGPLDTSYRHTPRGKTDPDAKPDTCDVEASLETPKTSVGDAPVWAEPIQVTFL
jgi:hypothetical protein